MDPILSPLGGVIWLAAFGGAMLALTLLFNKNATTKEGFLVGGRTLGAVAAGASIAATWIWAPALFVSAQKAYTQGMAGLFWFTAGNVLALALFGWFAARLRDRVPEGYTLSDYMGHHYKSARVQVVYLIQLAVMALCGFAVQLLAGSAVISALTGLPYAGVTVVLGAIAVAYSLRSGLRASVLTDYVQLGLILAGGAILVPWLVGSAGGWGGVVAGFGGPDGTFANILKPEVVLAFGIPVTILLLSGPFGNQSFWQRGFAVKRDRVFPAFLLGAFLFAPVPLLFGVPGFLATGVGFEASAAQMVGLEMVAAYLPMWAAVAFAALILCGLSSTLDSALCAMSSLAGHDVASRFDLDPVRVARLSVILTAGAAVAVANVPGLLILHLWLAYGTFRTATALPTALTIAGVRFTEAGIFWGVIAAVSFGLPVFMYGRLFDGGLPAILSGSIGTVLGSLAVALILTHWPARRGGGR